MLSQSEIARYLERCIDDEVPVLALEEVLSAYVAWKLIRGQTCEVVLQKLRYLIIYLRVTNRQWVLENIRQITMALATELSFGGAMIGSCPVNTVLGKEVWNLLRRKLSAAWYPFKTDPEYGGPITFHDLHSVEEPTNSQPDSRHSSSLPSDPGPSVSTTLSQDEHSAPFTSQSTPNSRVLSLSLFSLRQRSRQNIPQIPWSERPRWIRMWFFTRPHLAGRFNMELGPVPEYRSLVPAYTSCRGTLPLYLADRSSDE